MKPSKIKQRPVVGDQLKQPSEKMVAEAVTVWPLRDARLSVKLEDRHVHLDKQTNGYDIIIGDLVDVTAPDSAAQAFSAPRFYEQLADKIALSGLIAIPASGLMVGQQQAWQLIQTSLSEAFAAARGYGMAVPRFYH